MKDGLWLVSGFFLLFCAYSDLRSGMISVKSCLLAAGTGAAVRMIVLMSGRSAQESAWRFAIQTGTVRDLLPGLLVMGLAAASGEQIGKGDAWIMLALGALVGAGRCVKLFVTALIVFVPFAAVWCQLCRRRGVSGQLEQTREQLVPFAPSLFLAYVLLSFSS